MPVFGSLFWTDAEIFISRIEILRFTSSYPGCTKEDGNPSAVNNMAPECAGRR
jgi:hypothetical protein